MMPAPILNETIVRRLLRYNPATGDFHWLRRAGVHESWNTRYAGKKAGYSWTPAGSKTSYWMIRVFDWPFCAHRLAVLYMTGAWPSNLVDHADGDGLNNRWTNLRSATRPENMANSGAFKNSKTGLRGASMHKSSGKYRATITIGGKQRFLGYFESAEKAHAAYIAAAKKQYGEFARTP